MDEEARLHDLCSRAADIAADFPRGQPVDVDLDAEIGVAMTVVRRALMELYANLAVLNQDPESAVRFSLEQQVSNERLFATTGFSVRAQGAPSLRRTLTKQVTWQRREPAP